ncbi:hypothetical protein HYH03_009620 [Edaphochlamys debaryana]|uniref:Uncharacterized protein n=1 Tax=Edaphochlamys debaryana TaxID=47281 RepID=A0A836BYD4_9CHLO|nr:hypothetical protein HYH03_009620 [Edaphochlamys debaryana]|eukprot:KAG2492129.1 hypothetical protein HYH03_009620 [Edaphochlamys debaryana]
MGRQELVGGWAKWAGGLLGGVFFTGKFTFSAKQPTWAFALPAWPAAGHEDWRAYSREANITGAGAKVQRPFTAEVLFLDPEVAWYDTAQHEEAAYRRALSPALTLYRSLEVLGLESVMCGDCGAGSSSGWVLKNAATRAVNWGPLRREHASRDGPTVQSGPPLAAVIRASSKDKRPVLSYRLRTGFEAPTAAQALAAVFALCEAGCPALGDADHALGVRVYDKTRMDARELMDTLVKQEQSNGWRLTRAPLRLVNRTAIPDMHYCCTAATEEDLGNWSRGRFGFAETKAGKRREAEQTLTAEGLATTLEAMLWASGTLARPTASSYCTPEEDSQLMKALGWVLTFNLFHAGTTPAHETEYLAENGGSNRPFDTFTLRAALAAAAAIRSWRAEAAARAARCAATRPAAPPTPPQAASTSSRGGTSKVERRTTASGRGAAAAPGRQAPPDAGPSRGAREAPSGRAGALASQRTAGGTKLERRVAAGRGAGGSASRAAAAGGAGAAAAEANGTRELVAATPTIQVARVTSGRPNAAPPSPLTRQQQAAPAASQARALPTVKPVPYNPFAASRATTTATAPPPNGLAGALPPGLPAGAPSVPAPTAVVGPSAATGVTPRRPGVPSWGGTDSKPVPGPSHEEDEDHSVMCVMCLDGPRRFGFLHGTAVHTGVCEECSAVLRTRMPGLECLLCRQPVEEIVVLF